MLRTAIVRKRNITKPCTGCQPLRFAATFSPVMAGDSAQQGFIVEAPGRCFVSWKVTKALSSFLTIKILIASNHALSDFKSTGQFSYPDGYVLIAIITLLLCVLVLFLLKNSEPSFRLGAVVLTAILPALLIGWVWFAMLRFVEQEQLYKTSDPVGHYFVTRRAYELYRKQYRKAEAHKAIAQSKSGAWSWTADHGTAMEAAEANLLRYPVG